MGTNFSPGVPEVCLTSWGEGLWGIPHLRGLPRPYLSPWESRGDMHSHWGLLEHVSPLPRLSGEPAFLPGFLGVLKACQSWAVPLPREGGYL